MLPEDFVELRGGVGVNRNDPPGRNSVREYPQRRYIRMSGDMTHHEFHIVGETPAADVEARPLMMFDLW